MKLNEICLALRQGREPAARSGEFGGKYRWRAEIEAAGGDEEEGPRQGLPAGPGPAAGRLAGQPGRKPLCIGNHDLGPRPPRPITPGSAGVPPATLFLQTTCHPGPIPCKAHQTRLYGVRFHCATPNAGETPALPGGSRPQPYSLMATKRGGVASMPRKATKRKINIDEQDEQDLQDFFTKRPACNPGHPQPRTEPSPEPALGTRTFHPLNPLNPFNPVYPILSILYIDVK